MTKILVIGNLACPRHIQRGQSDVADLCQTKWSQFCASHGPAHQFRLFYVLPVNNFEQVHGPGTIFQPFSFLGRGVFLVSISFSTHVLGFSEMNNALVWAIASLRPRIFLPYNFWYTHFNSKQSIILLIE
jgi:hypothetical protein